jgi:hypothetical protein
MRVDDCDALECGVELSISCAAGSVTFMVADHTGSGAVPLWRA